MIHFKMRHQYIAKFAKQSFFIRFFRNYYCLLFSFIFRFWCRFIIRFFISFSFTYNIIDCVFFYPNILHMQPMHGLIPKHINQWLYNFIYQWKNQTKTENFRFKPQWRGVYYPASSLRYHKCSIYKPMVLNIFKRRNQCSVRSVAMKILLNPSLKLLHPTFTSLRFINQ